MLDVKSMYVGSFEGCKQVLGISGEVLGLENVAEAVCVLGCLGVIKIGVQLSAGTALCLERRSDVSGQGTVILTGNGYGGAGKDREGPWV